MAGALKELFTKVLNPTSAPGEMDKVRVVLVEAADRLLSPFSPVSSDPRQTLQRRGVEGILGVGVARVTAEGVHLTDAVAA